VNEDELFETSMAEIAKDPAARAYKELGAEVFAAPDTSQALAACDADVRAFLALVMCGAEVDNGGFEQLFENSSDQIALQGLEGAERFGLAKHAATIRRALARWLEIDQERDERDAELFRLDEDWYGGDEELQRRLDDFARAYLGDRA